MSSKKILDLYSTRMPPTSELAGVLSLAHSKTLYQKSDICEIYVAGSRVSAGSAEGFPLARGRRSRPRTSLVPRALAGRS